MCISTSARKGAASHRPRAFGVSASAEPRGEEVTLRGQPRGDEVTLRGQRQRQRQRQRSAPAVSASVQDKALQAATGLRLALAYGYVGSSSVAEVDTALDEVCAMAWKLSGR
jgi:hypothetical protein